MLFKIQNLCSNLSIMKQLYAALAGSTISNFIRPQWISSGVENIGIAGNSGNTQRQCKIQEGRPNLKLGGFGLTY